MAFIYCATFLVSIAAGLLVTWRVRNFAVLHGIGVSDTRQRDVHNLPVPRVGGAAIFLSFAAVVACVLLVQKAANTAPLVPTQTVMQIIFPATLVFALGLYDDLFSASPWLKLAVEALATVPIYTAGLRVVSIPVLAGHYTFSNALSFLVTLFWVLLITNAFNLVDGLDGLAAGSALFSTLIMFVMALINHHVGIAALTLALVGTIAGFLRFNFNPATIFLGDSGSLFIGFLLSVFALATRSKSSTMLAVAIPIVSFGLPIMETGLSVVRRFLSGKPLFRADRQHIHHKLLEQGFTQRQAVIILYAVSALCAMLSALLLYPDGPTVGIVLFVLGAGIWVGVQHLRYPEMFELGRVARRTIQQKHVIVNNLAIRRAIEKIKAANQMDEIHEILRAAFQENDFDGFELRPAVHRATGLAWQKNEFFRWERPARLRNLGSRGHWAIALELIATSGRNCGEFIVYRRDFGGPLHFDINLIIDEFQRELGNAIERSLRAEELQESGTTALAAAVGDNVARQPGALS